MPAGTSTSRATSSATREPSSWLHSPNLHTSCGIKDANRQSWRTLCVPPPPFFVPNFRAQIGHCTALSHLRLAWNRLVHEGVGSLVVQNAPVEMPYAVQRRVVLMPRMVLPGGAEGLYCADQPGSTGEFRRGQGYHLPYCATRWLRTSGTDIGGSACRCEAAGRRDGGGGVEAESARRSRALDTECAVLRWGTEMRCGEQR
eukprot:3941642-Rhodomonas_salina.3